MSTVDNNRGTVRTQTVKSERKTIFMYGQSNCAGHMAMASLQAQYQQVFPLIKTWNGTALSSLDYSTNNNQQGQQNNDFGCEFSLMTRIQSFYGATVNLCKPAWGNCGLAAGAGPSGDLTPDLATSHYHEATDMWQSMLTQLSMTRASIKMVVLIMGESDAHSPYATQYQTNLTNLIAFIRSNLNLSTLPFIITKISSSGDLVSMPLLATINTAVDSVVSGGTNLYSINTNSIGLQSDNIHYSAQGYEDLGIAIYNSAVANNLLT